MKELGIQNTEVRKNKTTCLKSFFVLFFCSVCWINFLFVSPVSATKRSEFFQTGNEILSRIVKAGGPGILDPERISGQTILMVFAAAEQEFSQKALQDVQKIVTGSKLNNFTAIGIVSSPEGQPEVQNLIERHNLTYPVLYDKEGLITKLKIIVYPTTLVIDRNGRLAYYYSLYASNYHDVISTQLNKIINDKSRSYINEKMVRIQQNEEIQKAQKEINRGNVESAVTTLTDLLKKGHDTYTIHLLLGYSFIKLQKPQKALSHFKKAINLQPDSTSADLGMGIAYSRAGQIKNAVSILTKIAREDPGSVFAYRELSRIFEEQNKIEKAIYYIKKELDGLTLLIKD